MGLLSSTQSASPAAARGAGKNTLQAALFQPRRARVQPFGAQKPHQVGVAPVAAGDEYIHKTAPFRCGILCAAQAGGALRAC